MRKDSQTTPSPEVKAILKAYCQKKREQLGDNWKEIESKRLAEETTKAIWPVIDALQKLRKPQ